MQRIRRPCLPVIHAVLHGLRRLFLYSQRQRSVNSIYRNAAPVLCLRTVLAPVCRTLSVFRNGTIFGWSVVIFRPARKLDESFVGCPQLRNYNILSFPPYAAHSRATPFCHYRRSAHAKQQSDQLTRGIRIVLDCFTVWGRRRYAPLKRREPFYPKRRHIAEDCIPRNGRRFLCVPCVLRILMDVCSAFVN